MAIVRGEGIKVWDPEGRSYTDLYGGHAVTVLGHSHPALVEAITEQSRKLIFYSNAVYSDVRARACKRLVEAAPGKLKKVFMCNSGTEANETALKMARKYTGKNGIVAMKEGFHGRTVASLSVTGIDRYRNQFAPLLEGTRFAEFGNMDSVRDAVDGNTAAVILEPVQSMAGMRTAPPEFFGELREYCVEKDILLIFDEIQTGFGRMGKMFAAQYYNVTPDMITCAKGIAGGFPAGAVLLTDEMGETIAMGEHGSTFGGGPLACAAMEATLKTIRLDGLLARVKDLGDHIQQLFNTVDRVKEVRGVGLLRGFKFDIPAKEVQKGLMEKGFIVGTAVSEPDVIRIMPPLITAKDDIDEFYRSMEKLLTEMN